MLPAMFRALPILLLAAAACGKSASKQEEKPTTPSGEETIKVPGSATESAKGGSADGATDQAAATDDPRFHIKPEEGTITVDKAEGKAGAAATAAVKLAPATGYHVATDYPIKLTLEAPAGVTV